MGRFRRPLGVTLVAILVWLQGLLHLGDGMYYLLNFQDEAFLADQGGELASWLRMLGMIVGAFVLFVVTSGILRGNAGTRIVLTILLAVALVGSIVFAVLGVLGPLEIAAAALAAIAIVLLWTPRATAFFRLQNASRA